MVQIAKLIHRLKMRVRPQPIPPVTDADLRQYEDVIMGMVDTEEAIEQLGRTGRDDDDAADLAARLSNCKAGSPNTDTTASIIPARNSRIC